MRDVFLSGDVPIGATSDTHYGHRKIIGYCRRPWLYLHTNNHKLEKEGKPYEIPDHVLEAHDTALVDRTNELVGEDGVLINGGDVAWGNRAKLAEYRDRLKVKKFYVAVGNHDDEDDLVYVFGRDYVAERWHFTIDSPGGYREVIVDHYPGHSWQGSHKGWIQLFGHVHANLDGREHTNPGWSLSVDIGVDAHDYKPWLWATELAPLMDRRRAAWQQWHARTFSVPKDLGGMAPARDLTPQEPIHVQSA